MQAIKTRAPSSAKLAKIDVLWKEAQAIEGLIQTLSAIDAGFKAMKIQAQWMRDLLIILGQERRRLTVAMISPDSGFSVVSPSHGASRSAH